MIDPPTQSSPSSELAPVERELRLKEAGFVLEWEKWKESRNDSRKLWASPVALTVIGAIVGLIATGLSNLQQSLNEAALERQKFESSLIQKGFESGNQEDASKYLTFLATTGLISDSTLNHRLASLARNPEQIPIFGRERGASELNARVPAGDRNVSEVIISDAQVLNALHAIRALQQRGNTGGSYHYLVDTSGVVVPLIPEVWEAYHTRGHNAQSISIGLAHVSQRVAQQTNVPYVPYTPRQVESLTRLVADIARRRNVMPEHILAKSEVDPSRPSDVPQILTGLRKAAGTAASEGAGSVPTGPGTSGAPPVTMAPPALGAIAPPLPAARPATAAAVLPRVLEVARQEIGPEGRTITAATPVSTLMRVCMDMNQDYCLKWIELVTAFQEEFHLDLADEDWLHVRTFGDVAALVAAKGGR